MVYWVIKDLVDEKYFSFQYRWDNGILIAMEFTSEENALGTMKQYAQFFQKPCAIEKVYHLK